MPFKPGGPVWLMICLVPGVGPAESRLGSGAASERCGRALWFPLWGALAFAAPPPGMCGLRVGLRTRCRGAAVPSQFRGAGQA